MDAARRENPVGFVVEFDFVQQRHRAKRCCSRGRRDDVCRVSGAVDAARRENPVGFVRYAQLVCQNDRRRDIRGRGPDGYAAGCVSGAVDAARREGKVRKKVCPDFVCKRPQGRLRSREHILARAKRHFDIRCRANGKGAGECGAEVRACAVAVRNASRAERAASNEFDSGL